MSEDFGVPFFDKFQVVCEEKDSVCFGLTPNGHKAFYDYGHFTLEGAKFFGARMERRGVSQLLQGHPEKDERNVGDFRTKTQ